MPTDDLTHPVQDYRLKQPAAGVKGRGAPTSSHAVALHTSSAEGSSTCTKTSAGSSIHAAPASLWRAARARGIGVERRLPFVEARILICVSIVGNRASCDPTHPSGRVPRRMLCGFMTEYEVQMDGSTVSELLRRRDLTGVAVPKL